MLLDKWAMWTIPELNNSLRPVLFNGEADVVVADNVGLYENRVKVPYFQDGRVYLTTERLIYVDRAEPKRYTISISLASVSDVEHSSGFYLKTSPKITCLLKPEEPVSDAISTTWACTICFMSNTLKNWRPDNEIPKCTMCGVKPDRQLIENSAKQASASKKAKSPSANKAECPRCTFKNHPSMLNCEMCGAVIKAIEKQQKASLLPQHNKIPITGIRISFRKGGDKLFLEKLTKCLDKDPVLVPLSSDTPISRVSDESPSVTPGLSGLQLSGQQRLSANDSLMESALVDLQALMTQGKQVLTLAKSFVSLVEAEGGTSTITVSSSFDAADSLSEDIFYQELSRDLSEFLHSGVLDREGGIISLFDLYALYNRSRGISLVSPNDLFKACAQMETLKLPVKMRRYKNGFLVVQEAFRTDDALTKQLVAWIKTVDGDNTKGVSTLGVCSKFKWSVGVAEEELQYAEEIGLLCRDEHVTGLRYFFNVMTAIYNFDE